MMPGFEGLEQEWESHLEGSKGRERQWPGWKTRLFTLEKRKPGDLTVSQFIIYFAIGLGIVIGLHGWPT